MTIWILTALFFLILTVITVVHYRINKEFKIETSWLALSLAPVVIWMLATQQLSEFSGFGLAFKLREVSASEVSLQVDGNAISPEKISSDEKGSLGKIESFKRDRVAAVTLVVGKQGYYDNRAIQKYLRELTPLSFFKYVLFENQAGEFRGVVSADKLYEEMLSGNLDLVSLIESGDVSSIDGIRAISIPSGSSKQQALRLIDRHGLSELPVVDEFGKFVGVVERDKITSSIVAQLVSKTD